MMFDDHVTPLSAGRCDCSHRPTELDRIVGQYRETNPAPCFGEFMSWLETEGHLASLLDEVGTRHECADEEAALTTLQELFTEAWDRAHDEALRIRAYPTEALLELAKEVAYELDLRGLAR